MSASIIKIGIKVGSWEGHIIRGEDCNGKSVIVRLPDAESYKELPSLLYAGCKLNILYATENEDGALIPRDIILNPDYLLDISTLSRCIQTYGMSPMEYILGIIEPSEESAARLLGEAANIFLDDCINENHTSPASYKNSMEGFFREYPLQLSACEGIDKEFFDNASIQFHNISTRMGCQSTNRNRFNREDALLEPSFFCEVLGLQGRIDLLQNDCRLLIELKSGKADDFNHCAKSEHRIQMLLYKEMLHYNLLIPRNEIKAMLFYSRYPRFYCEDSSQREISNVLMLRNKIVALLRDIEKNGLYGILAGLNPDDLNKNGNNGVLWRNYQRPRIERIIKPVKAAKPLLCKYVFGNIAFVAREMSIAKSGTESNKRKDNTHSFADVWNSQLQTKLEEGNILIDLMIAEIKENEGISDIVFNINRKENEYFPNFRAGDVVFMYRRECDKDNATNRQVIRGTLSSITTEEVTVHLRHKQRNRKLFTREALYAIEHDHMDSSFRSSIRDIYSLLSAPEERTELLLAQRLPESDASQTLHGDYGNSYINEIVLKAKQAKEMFLLVGPPGTGKTSQALKSMVDEFMGEDGCNILLASYTNRAVDEICQSIESLSSQPHYIRIGSEDNCHEKYRHRLLKNVIAGCRNRRDICSIINGTHLFVGTIASLSSRKELFGLKRFNVAIIDEATQILESQMAGLLAATSTDGRTAIEKFILIGDPKQLPAVVVQSPAESIVKEPELQKIGLSDYATSLFERLYNRYRQQMADGATATLYKQGRMHPEVSEFANKHFYGGILEPIPLPHQEESLKLNTYDNSDKYQTLLQSRRAAFIQVDAIPEENIVKSNRREAEEIAELIDAYYSLNIKNGLECNPSEEIGVIVPFRNQIAMVAHAINKKGTPLCKDITIDTVERFQGSQREMIIFGTTITDKKQMDMLSSTVISADGYLTDRKLNVALTRARKRMYIFGDNRALSASPLYKALIDELSVEFK